MPATGPKLVVACFALGAILIPAGSTGAATFDMPLRQVPGGGEPNGPSHDFWMGRYEVTVAQYIAFLNDAEANADNERGAYMVFDPNNGDVGLPNGTFSDDIFDISDCNNVTFVFVPRYTIVYDPNLPAGARYTYDPNDAEYPIVGVSWVGAVKFCNWLTIDHGLDPNQRCYAEGETLGDWQPVTIDKAEWVDRDLNDLERQTLVDDYVGYRLPMDNLGWEANGWLDGQPNPYNEWYKAAAYDANAPDTVREGKHGEKVPPDHWQFGYGGDDPDLSKANFTLYDANDPNGVDPSTVRFPVPVGTYAANNGNPWGIDDLSGNVYEWGQDYCNSTSDFIRHATHGKAFSGANPTASLRHHRQRDNGTHFVGLRVVQCGGYSIDVDTVNGHLGQVDIDPNETVYPPGTEVTLTATPIPNEVFSHWEGDIPPEQQLDPQATVLMDRDRAITAVFGQPPPERSLTVQTTGQGTVKPGSGTYVDGAEVTLTADPNDGWQFDRWDGDVPDGKQNDNPLTVVMDQDRALTGVFTEIPPPVYALTVEVDGEGEVIPGSGSYTEGTEVTLTADPNDGWKFDQWQGDLSDANDTDNPLTVTMDQDRTIQARFVEGPFTVYMLTVEVTGQGSVMPSSGPYTPGTAVRLMAGSASGWRFEKWKGDVPAEHVIDNPLTLVVDQDRTVTASFVEASATDPETAPCFPASAGVVAALVGWAMIVIGPRRRSRTL